MQEINREEKKRSKEEKKKRKEEKEKRREETMEWMEGEKERKCPGFGRVRIFLFHEICQNCEIY